MAWTPPDQSGLPCKQGKTHRFSVMSSVKGWWNCWWCGKCAPFKS